MVEQHKRQYSYAKKITSFLVECAKVNVSGGAATAYRRNEIWPSTLFHTDTHKAWSGKGSCMP